MIGKLMKYDLRSMLRTFLPLWGVLLVVAFLNRFTLQIDRLNDSFYGIPAILLLLLYVFGIMAIVVVALIHMIQRFYNGLLKDEGYLMFTLPVKTSQLIWAKCLSSWILVVMTGIACFLSIMLMVTDTEVFRTLKEGFGAAYNYLIHNKEEAALIYQALLLMLVTAIASIVRAILQAYFAMAIGHLANKHRAGYSFLAYIGISVALSTIGTSAMATGVWGLGTKVATYSFVVNLSSAEALWGFFGVVLLIEVVQIVGFFLGTNLILKKRLNLE